LRVPPGVAPDQVVIIPILRDTEADEAVLAYARRLGAAIGGSARVRVDETQHRSVEKKWKWIKRGAPIVVELGPKDADAGAVTVRTRLDIGSTETVPFDEFVTSVGARLESIQNEMLREARTRLDAGLRRDVRDKAAAEKFFSEDQGFVLAKWCGRPECEDGLKSLGVTIRCLPSELEADGDLCLVCAEPATISAVWAQSY